MVDRSARAAERLAQEGVEAEIVDLRWLSPMDLYAVRDSVSRTGRLVVVEEQPHAGGWGATVISEVVRSGLVLRATPCAVSMPDVPVPFSPPLEDAVLPSVEGIVDAVRSTIGG